MNAKELTIQIDGKCQQVSVEAFLVIVAKTVKILVGVDCAISGKPKPSLRWQITDVKMESPLAMTIAGAMKSERDDINVVGPFLEGLRAIEEGTGRPEHFSDDTLELAKALVRPLNNGVSSLVLRSGKASVCPTQRIAANVDDMLGRRGGRYYYTEAELEGTLDTISVHGDQREFCIYDVLTDDPIKCAFDESAIDDVIDLLRSRVRVSGLTKFGRRTHRPVSVTVTTFYRLRTGDELPDIEDLHRAGIDITRGKDSVDYIRGLRDRE